MSHFTSHFARGLGYAAALLALAGGCTSDSIDPSKPGEVRGGEAFASGNGGTHRGVISFDIDGAHDCTGVLIGPYHALTAAHCTNQAGTASSSGRMRRTVNYFDPQHGKRRINEEMGRLRVEVLETWQGLFHAAGWAGADLQSDLALVERVDADGVTPVAWTDTSSEDYMPIWLGDLQTVDQNTFYGGGYNGGHVGDLSSMQIDIAGSDGDSFWNIGLTYRLCKGDSGGPYLDSVPGYGEVLLGVAVAGDGVSKATPCTRNGGKQFGVRLSNRIEWINAKTDGMCTIDGPRAECF